VDEKELRADDPQFRRKRNPDYTRPAANLQRAARLLRFVLN
jgi:hypothetical protein